MVPITLRKLKGFVDLEPNLLIPFTCRNLSEYNEIPMEYQLKEMDSRVANSKIVEALEEDNSELEANLDEGNTI